MSYILSSVAFASLFQLCILETCPNMCNSHGLCDKPDRRCDCLKGFIEGDCSKLLCPFGKAWSDFPLETDVGHLTAECSNRGICDRGTGECICESGRFEGKACERRSCPNQCNGHGKCMSMEDHAEERDFGLGATTSDLPSSYTYTSAWDSKMMHGCVCDPGYFSPDCSLRHCPTGDDPLTGTASDALGKQFNEKQTIACAATDGTFTLSFRGYTTEDIPYDSSREDLRDYLEALPSISTYSYIHSLTVSYSTSLDEACTSNGNVITVEFTQDFGDVPLIIPSDLKLDHYNDAISLTTHEIVKGSKENSYCSNRGVCDTKEGECTCFDDWSSGDGYQHAGVRDDCSYATSPITTCPAPIHDSELTCSGHGVCLGPPTFACKCSKQWIGGDCSLRSCPSGRSWFQLSEDDDVSHMSRSECSDMGYCNRASGQCVCVDGYEGSACERMSCPMGRLSAGTTLSNMNGKTCSGHGMCLTMTVLAHYSTYNGDLLDVGYGSQDPNDASVWDYDKMQACYCDDGYIGYDCSLKKCPFGDDPLTRSQANEVQLLTCSESSGYGTEALVLTFRQQTTIRLYWDDDLDDLKDALEALSSIQTVSVTSNSDEEDYLCPQEGNSIEIEFTTEFGDLPLLQVATEGGLDSALISIVIEGEKEFEECNGRGICNRSSGQCECFSGYGSSDGSSDAATTKGYVGDCAYLEPYSLDKKLRQNW